MLKPTMQNSFRGLINLIVNENGNGHRELAKYIESGQISKEEAVIVEFYACLQNLDNKLNSVLSKL